METFIHKLAPKDRSWLKDLTLLFSSIGISVPLAQCLAANKQLNVHSLADKYADILYNEDLSRLS